MKTEYLVETYEKLATNTFCIIVSTQVSKKIKKPFFIGFFDKSDEEKIMKEIFNISLLFKEVINIEVLKRDKKTASSILSYRNVFADKIRNSSLFEKTKQQTFIK